MREITGLAAVCGTLVGAAPAGAQTVQGRVTELGGGQPIAAALVALVDSTGREVARSATSPSGGFSVSTGIPGRYHVLVRQIGQQPWRSPDFVLATGATYPVSFHVDPRPYVLPPLTVESRRARCDVRPGDSDVLGGLLAAAEIALQLARATADGGRLAFSTVSYLKRLDPDLRLLDSTDAGVSRLASWPIQSAEPESLRAWGFVREWSKEQGPTYYAPDVRVLFSDWFLTSHCFRVVEKNDDLLEVRFTPERRTDRPEIDGRLVLNRGTMELRRLEFGYVGLPEWVREGQAGGFVELRRLHDGAWIPRSWALRAPQGARRRGSPRVRLHGWMETGGRVTVVRSPGGEIDSAATRELLGSFPSITPD